MNAQSFRKILLLGGDIALLYLSLLGTVYFGFWGKFSWELLSEHLLPFSFLYFVWITIFYILNLYNLNSARGKSGIYSKIWGGLAIGFVIGLVFFYLFPMAGLTPKTNLFINCLLSGALISLWRKLFYLLFSSRFYQNVAILGRNQQQKDLEKEITNRPYFGYRLATVIDENDDILSEIQNQKINTLIMATDFESNPKIIQTLYQGLSSRINFLDYPRAYEMLTEKIPSSFVNQSWFLQNLKEGERRFYDQTKRTYDVFLALLFSGLALPAWPLISLLIKLEDGGPIFYRQKRIGIDKKPFFLNKFRSMRKEAEKETGAVWAEKEDPRVTKIGKFLRRTHLDELPQLINILKGDISFVGPRPERPEFVEKLEKEIPHYHIRHIIKPGFTGWAQINFRYGRSVMDSQEKFQYDLYYLKNRSLLLDLGILLKTFQLFFKKD